MNEVIISWHFRKDYDCSPGGGDRVGRGEDIPASAAEKRWVKRKRGLLACLLDCFFFRAGSVLWTWEVLRKKGAVQVLFPLSSTIIRGLLLRWEHQDDFLWIRSFGWTLRDSPDLWTPSGQAPPPAPTCAVIGVLPVHRRLVEGASRGWNISCLLFAKPCTQGRRWGVGDVDSLRKRNLFLIFSEVIVSLEVFNRPHGCHGSLIVAK